ncbi:MAG: ATP-binding protein [Rhodoferax sp.]|nr:ATP-binding protein [Rhodoferax sp.]MCF8210962.1 ATP-binding protein [Rhodoferax sp.]
MKKFFNTTGPCFPERHYMVDPLKRLRGVESLIDQGQYFVIHAPRQTGKTTFGLALMEKLNAEGRYTVLVSSIQPAAQGRDPVQAMKIAAQCIAQDSRLYLPVAEQSPVVDASQQFPENGLFHYLQQWSLTNTKPIVLLLDEVDALLDDNFLAMLYQLRAGFTARAKGGFPQSIGLIGLRDVRDYKIRIRPESQSIGTGSPFNVKAESFFMERLSPAEITDLLGQHTAVTGQVFEPDAIAAIEHLSQGQAWLVNALAYHIVQRILDNDSSQPVTKELVWEAKEVLIQRRDTHLDSLIDKLKEDRVRGIVNAIINGSELSDDRLNDALAYCQDLGIVSRKPPIRFANPIYQEIIPRVMSYHWQLSIPQDDADPFWYIKDGQLDMDALLKAFQKFYRRHSEAWLSKYDFREVGRQLLLMAFLQRIVNGGGSITREMAIGNGRADLVVQYAEKTHVLELKLKYHSVSQEEGMEQLSRYLTRLDQGHGYLLLFELDDAVPWDTRIQWQERQCEGKSITLVGL